MRYRWQKDCAYVFLEWFSWLVGFVLIVVGASLYAQVGELQKDSPLVDRFLLWCQQQAWWLLGLSVIGTGVAGWLRKWLGPPTTWKAIHICLKQLQQYLFSEDSVDHDHRITIFRHVRYGWYCNKSFYLWNPFTWCWTDCLIPVERSSHTTRTTSVRFYAPLNKPEQAEGVAGQAWVGSRVIEIKNLPDLDHEPNEIEVGEYASHTFVSPEWVRNERKKKALARSFLALPIEVNGREWGVLIIDSRVPKVISKQKMFHYRKLVGPILQELLEGV